MPSISLAERSTPATVVILGTGGTIAGTSARPGDNVGYTAAQRSVQDLLAAVPALAAPGAPGIEAEQLAQLDSKDMDHATWLALAQRVQQLLARPEVSGVVITHGTDTLEETAWWLHSVLAAPKPVVLVAAMRPATALAADGPQNLLDAVTVAATPGVAGVLAVLAGQVFGATGLRKAHTYRTQAFTAGDGGPIAVLEEGQLRQFRAWPQGPGRALDRLPARPQDWPWVEIVSSHAGARGDGVRALLAAGVRGLVVASTGNGTVHRELEAALASAQAAGVPVWRATRCADGVLIGAAAGPAAALSPWQARVALMLSLLD
ncbi:asparaginase [Aquabacterium sp. OR-4]|uniref:asparaginase n=1 Tax=Aquabacterium sp. OR-4 TaxID=2978127 RepID=UPI0021B1DECF|nr:asparaginase [Aquabacterium sp. OR-4]MDT7834900.1 asparaginase [Aquabacterium sp. OR-4]